MTLATEVKKLTESKPFYAVAGVGDYAVEKLRELPDQLLRLQSRRTEIAKDLPERARAAADKAEGIARELPEKAREYADLLGHKATEVYEDFASRGRKVVSKASGEAALELEEVSVAAEPPVAEPVEPVKKTRTTKAKA
jgi:predicted MPP superfamily phosphohydrolase